MAATWPVAAAATAFAFPALAAQTRSCPATDAVASGALLPGRPPLTYTASAPAAAPATRAARIRRGVGKSFLPSAILSTAPDTGYSDDRQEGQQPDVGRTMCLGSRRDHGSDQRLQRL